MYEAGEQVSESMMAARRHSKPYSTLHRTWQTTYISEYVGIALLLGAWIALSLLVTPFHRMFSINDMRIAYPYADHERVPVFWLFIFAVVAPLCTLVLFNIFARSSMSRHEATYLPFAIAIFLTVFLTDVIKNAVGRPRPDLLARCHAFGTVQPNVLVNIDSCTSPHSFKLEDGWRSFPSGHSSSAFAGLGFLSLFLAGQLQIFQRSAGGRDLVRALVCLSPLLGALMIAISRCEDYRHDVYDVCVGSVLGMSVAYWSYRRHWPELSSPWCDEPYPRPSTDSQSVVRWMGASDDEEAGLAAGEEKVRFDFFDYRETGAFETTTWKT